MIHLSGMELPERMQALVRATEAAGYTGVTFELPSDPDNIILIAGRLQGEKFEFSMLVEGDWRAQAVESFFRAAYRGLLKKTEAN